MRETFTMTEIDEAVAAVRARLLRVPRVGMILGSGLGDLANLVQNPVRVPYQDIPYWPAATVQGHAGLLVAGQLFGAEVMVLQGRVHFYEGASMAEITLPVRVMKRLGVEILVLTNAAGAINPDYEPGDVMLITDHIAMIGMAGMNPLRGPNLDEFGPRFPDMSQVYDRRLAQMVRECAAVEKIAIREGVYCGLSGPSFETPADLRFLRTIGADAVGMSTVPEAIVARHAGMRILGLSGISNKANLDGNTETSHAEVLAAGRILVPKMRMLIEKLMPGF
jgi:purine-nucleoside phosphorylase